MRKIKKALYLFEGQFQESVGKSRVWIGYLIGVSVVIFATYRYIGYTNERVYQIFEPYLVCMSDFVNILLLLIGYFIIISDAPFVTHRSVLALYRSSRSQWFCGMSLYIVIHSFLYYILPLFLSCLYGIRQGYLNNLWSRPFRLLVESPSQRALELWHLTRPFSGAGYDGMEPVEALFHTLLFIVMYSIILATILFAFNLLFNRAVGTAIVAAVHILGYILAFAGFGHEFSQWSLIYQTMFMCNPLSSTNVLHTYLYFLLILCLFYFIAPYFLKYADFKYLTGEENE